MKDEHFALEDLTTGILSTCNYCCTEPSKVHVKSFLRFMAVSAKTKRSYFFCTTDCRDAFILMEVISPTHNYGEYY